MVIMLNPFSLVVQLAHRPATFFLILVHKVRSSEITNYFGPMCTSKIQNQECFILAFVPFPIRLLMTKDKLVRTGSDGGRHLIVGTGVREPGKVCCEHATCAVAAAASGKNTF